MKSRLAYALAFNAETKTIQLDIYDSIGDAEWAGEISSRQVLEQVTATKDAETIQVRLNSAGGMVFEGLAIYNLLANHKARVEVTLDGPPGAAPTERTTPALSGTKEAIAMDPKEAIAKLETDLTASLARCKAAEERTKDAETALAESATALKAKTLECESNVNAFADLKAKYQTLEAAAIKAELDTLVGKKITPAQVEQFTDLRASIGPDKFKALVDGLPDLVLGKAVVSPDPKPKRNMSEAGSPLPPSPHPEAG